MLQTLKKWAATAALIGLMGLMGCGGPREKRLVLLNNANSPYWDAVRKGMQAAEKDFNLQSTASPPC